MKRLFTMRERMFIANSADWKCEICKTPLDNSFHADHIIPFSKGGSTTVCNGQALCRTCNLKKGNRMSNNLQLRPHQEEMIGKGRRNFDTGKPLVCDIAPGGGKTIGSLATWNAIKQYGISKLIVIVPTRALIEQWSDEAKNMGIDLIKGFSYDNGAFKESDGFAMTYAGLMTKSKDVSLLCERYDITVVFDEFHHMSEDENKQWGVSAKEAFNGVPKKILLTGTPWRHDGFDVLWINRDKNGNAIVDVNVPKRELIGESLRQTQFVPSKPKNLEFIDVETGELTVYDNIEIAKKELETKSLYGKIVRTPKNINKLFRDADLKLNSIRGHWSTNNAGGLIICADTAHARAIQQELFSMTLTQYPIVHSDMKSPHSIIDDFRNGTTKWIIAVEMIAEGIDIPRLQTIIYLSAKTTTLWIWQVVGRAERLKKHQRGDLIAGTSYFYYYSDGGELDEAIQSIIDEQKKAVIDEKDKDPIPDPIIDPGPGPGPEPRQLPYKLRAFETDSGDIKVGNKVYYIDDPVTQLAIDMYSNEDNLAAYDFGIQYEFAKKMYIVMNGMGMKIGNKPVTEKPEQTKSEMRESLRELMKDTLNTKMKPYFKVYGSRVGECYSKVNSYLNKKVGIVSIEDASLSQLQKRYQYLRELRIEDVKC